MKFIGVLFSLLSLVWTASAHATDTTSSLKASSPFAEPPHAAIGLGAEYVYGHFMYEEPSHMNDRGDLHGLRVSYNHRFRAVVLSAEFEYMSGDVAYDGYLQNTETGETRPHRAVGDDWLRTVRADVAFPQVFALRTVVSPCVGLLNRHLYDKTHGVGSYPRNIDQVYLPLGAQVRYFVNNDFSVALAAEYDLFLGGVVSVNLSGDDVNFQQRTGHGTRLTATFTGEIDGYVVKAQPYWQRWAADPSEVRFQMVEPYNQTDIYGATLGFEI